MAILDITHSHVNLPKETKNDTEKFCQEVSLCEEDLMPLNWLILYLGKPASPVHCVYMEISSYS